MTDPIRRCPCCMSTTGRTQPRHGRNITWCWFPSTGFAGTTRGAMERGTCLLSVPFPNHFTIVTGLYPEHHGLVANSFWDETKQARYGISDAREVTDGSWYSGTPLWSLAESQGMRTACFFWPGSEAKIAGFQPTYHLKFDDKIDDSARIEQVLEWLRLPESDRPHFITLYYSEPDHEGHEFGPDGAE